MTDYKELDSAILEILKRRTKEMTYVIANWIRLDYPKLRWAETKHVLRRLKALKNLGMVEQASSVYARQLCWALAAPKTQTKMVNL